MRYKYSELTPEKLKEIEAKATFVTKEYGVGKDPQKDPPDFIETDRPPSLQIPRWAAIKAEELARQGMEMDEIYKVLLQEHKTRNGKADYVSGNTKTIVSGPNGEAIEKPPELTDDQIIYIQYLATICRMAGVNPKGLSPQEMMDVAMASNVNAVPFEEYRERQLELRKQFEEEKK
jgi:hypothetical protein